MSHKWFLLIVLLVVWLSQTFPVMGTSLCQNTDDCFELLQVGLGFYYRAQWYESLTQMEAALTCYRKGRDRYGEGMALSNIGVVYKAQGQYMEALEYYGQALLIFREMGSRADEGTILNNIGVVYRAQGRYAEALDYYEQALAIRREINSRRGEAETLHNIGRVYIAQGRPTEALSYYGQALVIFQEIMYRFGEAMTLNNISVVYNGQAKYEEALEYYRQALMVFRGIEDRTNESMVLSNIGIVHYYRGQYIEALNYLEQALAIDQEIGDRVGEEATLSNIGLVYSAQEQHQEALVYYTQSLMIAQELGSRNGEGVSLYNIGSVYASLGQHQEALGYYEQAMDVWESLRSIAGSDQARSSFIGQYADVYHRAIYLYHVQGQDVQAFYTTERGRARTFLDGITTGYVQLSDVPSGDQLAQLAPERGAVLDLPQVRARLSDQTTLITYWVLEEVNQVLVFIITRDTLHTVAVDVPYDDLVAAVNDFRNFTNLDAVHSESLVRLYGWLIAPLQEHLTTPHLAIIPHDVLHYLPFAALTDGERFLVEDYTITYLPSASALPFIQENAGRAGASALILGNPTTGDYDATASFATERDGLGPLPFAEQEAQAIAALYGVPAYVGEEATEGLVRQMAGESGILHLAAHGKYNPVAPLSSLIALAPDDEYDGWLTVGEVYGLDLQQANLVVLSACETQLGDLSRGDELVGMTRAFIYAGTPTVIASLWTVEDQATAQLMGRFYTHLQAGMGKAAALRQAQLDIQAEYPHPYYWAGFVLSGDGGEVRADAKDGGFMPHASNSRRIWLGGGVALCASLGCLGGAGLLFITVWAVRKGKRRG